jgi:hypothetical protein
MGNRKWLVLGLLVAVAAFGACGDDSGGDDAATDTRDVRDVADEGASCPTGQEMCASGCVNLQSAHDNCGACDNACATNELCRGGECVLDCPASPDYADCGGTACASLLADSANCGSCGDACGTGETCSCGTCVSACIDLNTDAANCGVCGTACGTGDVCCCGQCMASADCPAECTMIPIPDQLACEGGCSDGRYDMMNCGECGRTCTTTQRCGDGICTSETCTGAEVYCDGRCTDIINNSQNCGRCGNACDPIREVCFDGACRVSG